MRLLLTIVLAVVCLALGGVTFVLVAGPSDLLRDQLAETVKAETGRDLVVGGPVSFTLWPKPGIAMADVTLSDPAAMVAAGGDQPFLRVASLEMAVPLRALARQVLAIDQLVLKGAVLDLRVDAQGRRNWDLDLAAKPPARGRRAQMTPRVQVATAGRDAFLLLAQAAASGAPDRGAGGRDIFPFENVLIVDGTVRYRHAVSGQREEVTGLDLQAQIADSSGRLELQGKGVWRRETVHVQGTVGSVLNLIDGATPVAAKLSARLGEVVFEGTVATGPVPQVNGRLKSTTPSAAALEAWLGTGLGLATGPSGPTSAGAGALGVAGTLSAKTGRFGLRDMVATLDGTTVRGEASLATDGPRPFLQATVAIDRLDLNGPWLGGQWPAGSARPPASAGPPTAGARPAGGSIGELIEAIEAKPATAPSPAIKPAPPGRPAVQVRGWSSQPLDLGVLRLLDADLKLDAGQIAYRDLVLDRTRVSATLREGTLKATFQDAALYKGRATGTFEIDQARDVPRLALKATLEGVEMLPLLKAVAGLQRLSGRGTMVLQLSGQGRNAQQISESLAGTAAVTLADGAILGIDVAAMLATLRRGQMPHPAGPGDRTDLSELSGTFQIAGGVARTQDLKLVSPALRMTGTGGIDLGRQLLDLQVKPKLNGPPSHGNSGQNGTEQVLSQLDIPVLVRGPWDAPRMAIDINSALKDPDKVRQGVEQIGEALKGKDPKAAAKEVGNVLRNLLGGR